MLTGLPPPPAEVDAEAAYLLEPAPAAAGSRLSHMHSRAGSAASAASWESGLPPMPTHSHSSSRAGDASYMEASVSRMLSAGRDRWVLLGAAGTNGSMGSGTRRLTASAAAGQHPPALCPPLLPVWTLQGRRRPGAGAPLHRGRAAVAGPARAGGGAAAPVAGARRLPAGAAGRALPAPRGGCCCRAGRQGGLGGRHL